jgi:hypothetical protein
VGFFLRPAGINRQGFDLIQVGMSQRDVEAILGGPPGVYGQPEDYLECSCLPLSSVTPETDGNGYRGEAWYARGRLICVYFRPDGTVADKGFVDRNMFPERTELERSWRRFRRWINW